MWWERDPLLLLAVKTKGLDFGREAINARDENLIPCDSEPLDAPVGLRNDVAPVRGVRSGYIYLYDAEVRRAEVRKSQQLTSNKERDEVAFDAAKQKLWHGFRR